MAGVAQLVELQPSKLDVTGSNPVARSTRGAGRPWRPLAGGAGAGSWGRARGDRLAERRSLPRSERGFQGVRRRTRWHDDYAHVAQSVERVLGKDEVTSSILVVGSRNWAGVTQWLESRPSKPLVAGSNPVSRSS